MVVILPSLDDPNEVEVDEIKEDAGRHVKADLMVRTCDDAFHRDHYPLDVNRENFRPVQKHFQPMILRRSLLPLS